MEEFNPLKVNQYTIDQLVAYITSGAVTKEDLYQCGLLRPKREELENKLRDRERPRIEDDEVWATATNRDTIEAYQYYLSVYDVPEDQGYRGRHVIEARMRIEELKRLVSGLYDELYDSLRNEPHKYVAETMKALIKGINDEAILEQLRQQDDIASRFISKGLKLSFNDLLDAQIIPQGWQLETITAPDFNLTQTNINELGDFPEENRTDIFFFGVPRGGKSSVLAGILTHLNNKGLATYDPQYNHDNIDRVWPYYRGLINSTSEHKFPISTERDSLSFIKLDIGTGKSKKKVTFVEIGGEAFNQAALTCRRGSEAWENLGAGKCLATNNRKLLLFVIDYAIPAGARIDGTTWSETGQAEVLERALQITTSDGTGRRFDNNCTMSKVDTVGIIVTKSDLMGPGLSGEERDRIAEDYVYDKYNAFMKRLIEISETYGINKVRPGEDKYRPYVLSFSLGDVKIGNTYVYNSSDSETIGEFISTVVRGEKKSLFATIFGK